MFVTDNISSTKGEKSGCIFFGRSRASELVSVSEPTIFLKSEDGTARTCMDISLERAKELIRFDSIFMSEEAVNVSASTVR